MIKKHHENSGNSIINNNKNGSNISLYYIFINLKFSIRNIKKTAQKLTKHYPNIKSIQL